MNGNKIVMDYSAKHDSIIVKFDYNKAYKDICSALPDRRWLSNAKLWLVPSGGFYELAKGFSKYSSQIEISSRLRRVIDERKLDKLAEQFQVEEEKSKINFTYDFDIKTSSLIIKFEYHPALVEIMRKIKDANWNNEKKVWYCDFEDSYRVLKEFNELAKDFKSRLIVTKTTAFINKIKDIKQLKYKKSLTEDQIGVNFDPIRDIIVVKFGRKDPDWVEKIKELSGRFYDSDKNNWEFSVSNYKKVLSLLRNLNAELVIDKSLKEGVKKFKERKEKQSKKKSEKIIVPNFIMPRELHDINLYDFQKEGVQALLDGYRFLGHEMGLGKSIMAITYCLLRKEQDGIKKVLIVCPNSIKDTAWGESIRNYTNSTLAIVEGDKQQRLKAIRSDSFFTVINYDALRNFIGWEYKTIQVKDKITGKSKDIKKPVKKFNYFGEEPFDVLIFDEAHRVKSPTSGVTNSAFMLKADTIIVATGTPIMKSVEDIACPMVLAKPDIFGKFGFRDLNQMYNFFLNQYAQRQVLTLKSRVKGGKSRQVKKIIGYKNLDDLQDKISSIMIRRTKEQVLKELPDKVFQVHQVELYNEQKKLYNQFLTEAKVYVNEKEFSVKTALTKLLRCKQAAAGLEILGGKVCSAKADLLESLLDDLICDEEKKVLIFTQFTTIIDKILVPRFSDKFNASIVSKSGENAIRDSKIVSEQVKKFQNDKTSKLFIGSLMACREGITLTKASSIIMFDLPWDPGSYDQVIDRAHRIGQKKSVLVIDLIAKDTIEGKVLALLHKRRKIRDYLMMEKGITQIEAESQSARLSKDDIKKLIQ